MEGVCEWRQSRYGTLYRDWLVKLILVVCRSLCLLICHGVTNYFIVSRSVSIGWSWLRLWYNVVKANVLVITSDRHYVICVSINHSINQSLNESVNSFISDNVVHIKE